MSRLIENTPDVSRERVKVTMELTTRDAENTETLARRFHARSKASVVSTALSLTAKLTEAIENGCDLYLKDKNGEMQRIVITGL